MAKRRNVHDVTSEILIGNGKDNEIDGTNGNDRIEGRGGHDTLRGNMGDDVLRGENGNDDLHGNGGHDVLRGDAGNDRLDGGRGDDQLYGGAGNDILDGGIGADTMNGGTGDNAYHVDDIGDVIIESADGGDSFDAVYSTVSYTLGSQIEYLKLEGTADINGTGNARDNYIEGNEGSNILRGGAGNDHFFDYMGNDTFYGGAGDDMYYLPTHPSMTVIEFDNEGIDTVDTFGSYVLPDFVENLIISSQQGAIVHGNDLANVIQMGGSEELQSELYAHGGDDIINMGGKAVYGGDGNDLIQTSRSEAMIVDGGAGNDSLQGGYNRNFRDGDGTVYTGGEGADHFRFFETLAGNSTFVPRITDFEHGVDIIEVWPSAVDYNNGIDASEFYAGTEGVAQTAAQRVIFDTDTGMLFYDPDGNGAQAQRIIALLEGTDTFTYTDIAVVDFLGAPTLV